MKIGEMQKLSYVEERKIEELNKSLAKEFYLNFIDSILEPIIEIENRIIADEEINLLTLQDLHDMAKEIAQELRKIKAPKFEPQTEEAELMAS